MCFELENNFVIIFFFSFSSKAFLVELDGYLMLACDINVKCLEKERDGTTGT